MRNLKSFYHAILYSLRGLLICLISLLSNSSSAQTPDPYSIRLEELGARLSFLSSDLLQGRKPGTTGEKLTTSYLISELQSFGVKPGNLSSWLQPVQIIIHKPDLSSYPKAVIRGRVNLNLRHGPEIVLFNYTNKEKIEIEGELVFVGYGIYAPKYAWDDFKDIDLRGKVAIAIFGIPRIPGDTILFNGKNASRYSSMEEKITEMNRRGAVGVLWITPSNSALYSDTTYQPRAKGVTRLEEDANNSKVLFMGFLKDSFLYRLLPEGSISPQELFKSTKFTTFQPIPLGVQLSVKFQTRPTLLLTNNVVGLVPGSNDNLRSEHIVVSAHWDALGIRQSIDGDSICNGALDNASGLTSILALARVFAANPQPRSITFLFCTAEEIGLLGSDAFVRFGPLPSNNIIANLNVDEGGELFGRKSNVAPLGMKQSSLGKTVTKIASKKGLSVSVDPFPEEGYFLRSDNYPFARLGIPSLYMALGIDDIDHNVGWTKSKYEEYNNKHYHQVSDNYDNVVFDLRGAVQFAEFTRDLIIELANSKEKPKWLPNSEYSRFDHK